MEQSDNEEAGKVEQSDNEEARQWNSQIMRKREVEGYWGLEHRSSAVKKRGSSTIRKRGSGTLGQWHNQVWGSEGAEARHRCSVAVKQ